jgi:hypothetical protein
MFGKKEIKEVTTLSKSALSIRDGDEVIRSFIEPLKCDTILEIGTYRGIGSLYMSQFCRKLYTIDLVDGLLEYQIKKGIVKDKLPVRHQLWEMFKRDNIFFMPVKCNNSKIRVIKKLDFDICFIDGGHSFEDAKLDFELVKHCGKVLFHDYDFSNLPKRDGVWNFVNTLPKEQLTVRDIFALWEDK